MRRNTLKKTWRTWFWIYRMKRSNSTRTYCRWRTSAKEPTPRPRCLRKEANTWSWSLKTHKTKLVTAKKPSKGCLRRWKSPNSLSRSSLNSENNSTSPRKANNFTRRNSRRLRRKGKRWRALRIKLRILISMIWHSPNSQNSNYSRMSKNQKCWEISLVANKWNCKDYTMIKVILKN